MDNNELLDRVQQQDKWVRALYMLLFLAILWLVKLLFLGIILLQFVLVLISDQTNLQLLYFAKSLSRYAYQICLFLTFNSETKPFPFSDWPNPENN